MSEQVKIKKIKPYPIAASLKYPTGTLPGQIVKLTQHGFLVECAPSAIQPGEKFECSFELPTLGFTVNAACVVVKLYNHMAGASPAATEAAGTDAAASSAPAPAAAPAAPVAKSTHLIEGHFITIAARDKERVTAYLTLISKGGMR